MILLTQETGFLKPIAFVLGKIFDLLFMLVDKIGIPNIGICVILFTIIVRLLLLPLTIKQQRFSKLSNMMQPELQAIQAKYKDKKDNESVMKMNEETKAVYAKYGSSPSGGCVTMLIQLPIMFALYRVIYKIPGYVTQIKTVCTNLYTAITANSDWFTTLNSGLGVDTFTDGMDTNSFIDAIYKLTQSNWETVKGLFSNGVDAITTNSNLLLKYNNFLGLNLQDAPGWKISWALLIPLLAGVTQWISAKLSMSKQKTLNTGKEDQSPLGGSMKMMNTIMPIMSAVFCVTFPMCIGVYWITSSLVQIIQQIFINRSMERVSIEEMVQKNIDKENAKRAKKGLPPRKITNTATTYVQEVKKAEAREARKGERNQEIKKSTEYYNTSAKPGSLAAKANMVKMYNEKNNKN